MAEDLPIYSDSTLRTRLQFADLEKLKGIDLSAAWEKSDGYIERLEGAGDARKARESIHGMDRSALLAVHSILFGGKEGAGILRQETIKPLFRGQDCPDPQFIERSVDNFFNWLTAESIAEIHPIERAALIMTRIVDIWPFQTGTLTVAIMFANICLKDAGFAPFFVLPVHIKEFKTAVGQAMTIETQPLVNAIYKTVKREMEALAP